MEEPYYCERCRKEHRPHSKFYTEHNPASHPAWTVDDTRYARLMCGRVLPSCIIMTVAWIIAIVIAMRMFSDNPELQRIVIFARSSSTWIGLYITGCLGFFLVTIALAVTWVKDLPVNTLFFQLGFHCLGFIIVLPLIGAWHSVPELVLISIITMQLAILIIGNRSASTIAEPWHYKSKWLGLSFVIGSILAITYLFISQYTLFLVNDVLMILIYLVIYLLVGIVFSMLVSVAILAHVDEARDSLKAGAWRHMFSTVLNHSSRDLASIIVYFVMIAASFG